LPPLPVRTPPRRPSHAKSCHPERSEGSAFLSICPLLRTDFRIPNFAFRFPLATLTGAISPATHYPLLTIRFLNTQDLPQTLSHHALAHNLRDTPRWGAALAASPSPLATVLLFSYCYALFCTAQIAISHPFNAFRTLCAKHPGWRGGLTGYPSERSKDLGPSAPSAREKSSLIPAPIHQPLTARRDPLTAQVSRLESIFLFLRLSTFDVQPSLSGPPPKGDSIAACLNHNP
jgi:hypothetical protein